MIGHVSIATTIYDAVGRTSPESILDLGVGNGLWGALIRNYYGAGENGCIFPLAGPVIHGIEKYPRYRNPMWDLYNQVLIGDVIDYMHTLHEYDLIIASNILEHLPKESGGQILRKSKSIVCGMNKIDIPAKWREDELHKMGFTTRTLSASYFAAWRLHTAS